MEKISDIKLNNKQGAADIIGQMKDTGFQASHLAEAVELIEQMKKENCTIFLGFTANMMASGLRGIVREMCEKKFVDAIVTTAGSIDHDIIKSFMPYGKGAFNVDDIELHKKGVNRIGNIFVENKGFEILEEKIQPWFSELYAQDKSTSPSELNEFIGSTLPEESFLHHCTKNNIPVFCPGITDGAIGLQMYFFKQEHADFVVDVTKDMKRLADTVLNAEKTAAIILGGGISKHHIIGANLVRDGLDYAVYVSTAVEYDGSLSGAQTKEAKSWGKIKEKGSSVQVHCDATIALPLIAASLKEKGVL
ncbi:MAG: deoxyhypusine synthase [Candidatus Diapherotrites archaeon]|uniref:Deoxyhypusine synthase n=1 Tax=Candidatus Iainarchaeum sp. TaxID=3101447 RepID=A0A2D6M1Y9_9ARCH|nr:deoxyhypusine synthase [Candidatus Diapherotrites archaeon]|tara:strand:+ start:533 stop:1450 length:918 start_codon:yes stop_codon:yes gene_type:complete